MKSQVYHEIEVLETFPKKRKKQTPPPTQLIKSINPKRSRPSRSQQRSILNSVSLLTHPREPQPQTIMLRSKPSLPSVSIENCAQWAELKCIDCESIRNQNSKKIRELQMKFEEELTQCKQRCVQMQKKYLQKEHELISFMNEYEKILEQGNQKEDELQAIKQENIFLRQKIQDSQRQNENYSRQIEGLMIQKKQSSEKLQTMHYFLKLYQQQAKMVIGWARILNRMQEQDDALQLLKQEIISRRFDCEVTLKQAITFEKLNFSEIHHCSGHTSFTEQDSGCESFMKYLHQEGVPDKTSISLKAKQNPSEKRWEDKENIDWANIVPLKSLLNSKKKQINRRPKADISNDQIWRILLAQAKTMESYSKGQSPANNQGHLVLDTSYLCLSKSVICK